MLRLRFCGVNSPERVCELSEGKTTIGRGQSNALRITDDSVSRAHGELIVWGADVIVRDLGSRNGTWIGDKALYHRQCGVKVGEVIRFGSVRTRLELNPQVRTEHALDEAMEDMTAIHHYSQFMQRILDAKQDNDVRRAADDRIPASAIPSASAAATDADMQTMMVRRFTADPCEANAAVAGAVGNAAARHQWDPRKIPALLILGISTSCLSIARRLRALH
jgi:hypothetical protein